MKILVVGGAGFIGSVLTELLVKKKHTVKVFDKFIFDKNSLSHISSENNLEIIKADISNTELLDKHLENIDQIVHLAGIVGEPACAVNKELTLYYNNDLTKKLVDASIRNNIKRFVFASSCTVYGCSSELMTEEYPLNPLSLYAKTKCDMEKYILQAQSSTFLPTVLRFGTLFGHSGRMRFDLVANLFVSKAYNQGELTTIEGKKRRTFIHVADVARAVLQVIEAEDSLIAGQIFNVTNDILSLSIDSLADKIFEIVPKDRKGNKTIIMQTVSPANITNYSTTVSGEKITKVLGFKPSVDFNLGLTEILENVKSNKYEEPHESALYSNVKMTGQFLEQFQTNGIRSI